jgi:hypothetical protein
MAYQMTGYAADNGAFDTAGPRIGLSGEADDSEAKQRRNDKKISHVKLLFSPYNCSGRRSVRFPPAIFPHGQSMHQAESLDYRSDVAWRPSRRIM